MRLYARVCYDACVFVGMHGSEFCSQVHSVQAAAAVVVVVAFFFCLILFPRLHRARSPSLTKFRHSQAHRNIGKLHAHETGTNEC